MSRIGVGIIGTGDISTQYLNNLTQFADVKVVMVADVLKERADAAAAKYGVLSGEVKELLSRDDIQYVLNLTNPAFHTEVGHQIIAAGKNVWSEKPLALDKASAAKLLDAAKRAGVRVGCAPDTVLGAGIQTALRAIARGDIGVPLTANTVFQTPGPESWHPSPEFLFAEGAGPLFDMGPYYLTTLVHALGSAVRVQAVSSKSLETRVVGSGPKAGKEFPVEVPTHHSALIEFVEGKSAQSVLSFQHAMLRYGVVEINGTEGTICLPDPNMFDGSTTLYRYDSKEPVILEAKGSVWGRGTGLVEMARAITEGKQERASGALASHVLDIMLGIRDAAKSGEGVKIISHVDPVPALPEDFDPSKAVLA